MATNIAFIDSRVADYQALIDGLAPGTEWYLINAEEDGVAQIESTRSGHSGIDALHIISHGSVGTLYLGNTVLNSDNLTNYQTQWQAIGASLTATGDILLYGCNAGDNGTGIQFIKSLALLTSADIAASSDATGAATLGGSSVLEIHFGVAEATATTAITAASFGVMMQSDRQEKNDHAVVGWRNWQWQQQAAHQT